MRLFQSDKAPTEPYQPNADWHLTSLHSFSCTYEFENYREVNLFLLETIQIHDDFITIEATSLNNNKVVIVLRTKQNQVPCTSQECSRIIQEIERLYREHSNTNNN